MKKLLLSGVCIASLLGLPKAHANFAVTQGSGTTIFAIDSTNQGTSSCAAANTECPSTVLINTAGAPIGVAATPLQVSLANTGANGTAILVTGTGGTFPIPANSSVNLSQVGGSSVALGSTTSSASVPVVVASDQGAVATKFNSTPSLANGNGVVPTQGGSVLSATNGGYTNVLQGNAVLATSNPLFITGSGTAGTPATNPITIQGISGGTAVPISQASGSVASGAYSSGAFASGAYASGSLAVGAGTDGWNVTEGTKADKIGRAHV